MLLTDGLFPSKYAKWRIEEIKSFIDEMGCDILVNKVDSFNGISYGVDYEDMSEYYGLKNYNILIFDSRYNYLNKYNKNIDGTKFNSLIQNYSYIFTKHRDFDISRYEKVYHIFLSNYNNFNKTFADTVDNLQQYIHLYPNGGYSSRIDLRSISKDVGVIASQPFIENDLKSIGHKKYISVFGSTVLPKNFELRRKPLNNSTLSICFSNMGVASEKGYDYFRNVVKQYNKTYRKDDIRWYFVGNSTNIIKIPEITYIPPMSQKDLDDFYYDNVDILLNPETGDKPNGFPLGVEAAIQGVVLITTDTKRSNEVTNYTSDMLYVIRNERDYSESIRKISKLYKDRIKLNTMSKNIQDHTLGIFSYDNQQRIILNYVKNSETFLNREIAMKSYREVCPSTSYEDNVFSISNNVADFLKSENVQHKSKEPVKQLILDNLSNRIPFTISRWNDGEWIVALRINDHNIYDTVLKPKLGKNGQIFSDKYLKPIMNSKPKYYIGVSTEVFRKRYISDKIVKHIHDLKLVDGGLFARWGIEDDMHELLTFLKDREIILVGPKYLNGMKKFFPKMTIVESGNWKKSWDDYDKIKKDLIYTIRESKDTNPIILYCASLVAKALIDYVYHNYSNVSQLDIGAAFDPYCGIVSRPWHEFIGKHT